MWGDSYFGHLLVNGRKQPGGLFVKGHNHFVKTRHLGGDLGGDVGIWQLICAHAGVLWKKEKRQYEAQKVPFVLVPGPLVDTYSTS